MVNDEIKRKRDSGEFYTPPVLAEYLVDTLLDGSSASVFDPSYGDGALLLAAEKVFNRNRLNGSKLRLCGCDINPVNGLLTHLPEANLVAKDFFEYDPGEKYDFVLTNPPYIRHQSQKRALIQQYRATYPEFKILNNSADLWAYFMIKSTFHLRAGGTIGAILPWSLLQAKYAQDLRNWLFEKFEKIRLLTLNHKYFEPADERVVILWLKGYGKTCNNIEYSQSFDIKEKPTFNKLPKHVWKSSNVIYSQKNDLSYMISKLRTKFRFSRFGDYAKIRIGVVTGANSFFIKTYQQAIELGLEESDLQPIITSTKELPFLINQGASNLKRMICITPLNENRLNYLIQEGQKKGIDSRAHSKLRTPWYSVKQGEIPDAFFPYRISSVPYLVRNDFRVQATNSIHRIYYQGLNETQIKWIHVSLLSVFSQVSLRSIAKTYGRGMLKIEPGPLSKALVVVRDDNCIDEIYFEVMSFIGDGNKSMAVALATDFLEKYLDIPRKITTEFNLTLEDLRCIL